MRNTDGLKSGGHGGTGEELLDFLTCEVRDNSFCKIRDVRFGGGI